MTAIDYGTTDDSFVQSYPIDFDLHDDQDQNVLYIDDNPGGLKLYLDISNASQSDIELAATTDATPKADNHHFELRFRPGTLSDATASIVAVVETDWTLGTETNDDGTVSFYFLYSAGLTLAASDTITLTLQDISAEPSGGARGTQVALAYQQLNYAGDTETFSGTRVDHISIVNHSGEKYVPLHAGFLDGNTVLNNGESANELYLRLSNVSDSGAIALSTDTDAPTKFILSFDCANDDADDWALESTSLVEAIEVGVVMVEDGVEQDDTDWSVTLETEGATPEWVISNDSKAELAEDEFIQLKLSNIITAYASGHTNLYLNYKNIPGYWDGQFVCTIDKGPLVCHEDKIGIGTNAPERSIHVKGNGLLVERVSQSQPALFLHHKTDENTTKGIWRVQGSDLFSINDDSATAGGASTYRLVIDQEGHVGIGTESPKTSLHIYSDGSNDVTVSDKSSGHLVIGDVNSKNIAVDDNEIMARNNASTSDLYLNNNGGDVRTGGTFYAASKNFVIDHPGRPGYRLVHSCVEGPEAAVYYRGEAQLTGGTATVQLPDYFEALTRREGRTVQLTAKGSEPFLMSATEVENGSFTAHGSLADGYFYWEVKAVRSDIEVLAVEVVE